MRALLVDNDRLLLDSLRVAIEARRPDIQVDTAADEKAALGLAKDFSYELILLDWWLGNEAAADCFKALRELCPSARIVVMSGDDSIAVVHAALELGACGFLRKNAADVDALREAIDVVLQGGIYLPTRMPSSHNPSPSVRGQWVGRDLADCFPQLTERQIDVLRVMLQGASDKVIARRLDIAVTTVKTHTQEVYRRIGAAGRAEAVAIAARLGVRID